MTAPRAGTLLWTLAALAAHWRRRPGQLLAMLAGLAAATSLWSGVQALNAEARASYATASGFVSSQGDSLVAADGGPVAQEAFVALRRAGWPVSPVIEGAVFLGDQPLGVLGVDLLTAAGGVVAGADAGRNGGGGETEIADFLLPPWRTWMAPETMRRLGLNEGDTPGAADGAALPPVVPRAGVAPGTAMMDIGAAQALLGMDGQVTRLALAGEPSLDAPPLETVAPELRRMAGADPGDLERLTASFHLNLTAFGLLSFVVGLFIVYAAAGLAFEQRLPAMRTMRACGVSRRTLSAALAAELLILALVAGVAGIALGYVIAATLLPGVSLTLRSLYGAPAPGTLTIRPEWWVSGLAMSVAGAVAALGASLAKAWRLPVLAPALPVAWMRAQQRWARIQAGAGLALLAACAALLAFGDGLGAGFAAMAALLLGSALLLPPALSLLLLGAQRMTASAPRAGPVVEWFWADARRDMSGVSLALMALLLALGANIGVGSMVGGFRATFTEWLEQRLAADIYLNVADPERLAAAEAFLAGREDVEAVLPTASAEARVEGWPVEVQGLVDHPLYRDFWPLREGPADWEAVARGEAVLVSEQTARRLGLQADDMLILPAPAGDWEARIAGVYADYGNPRGQVIVTLDALLDHWPDARPSGLEVVVRGDRTGDVIAAMRANFGPALGPVLDQRSIRSLSLSIFERTFAVTGALNVLTLAVAGVALLASLTALAQHRLPQLAPVWALGATRRRLALLELGKTLALAALTAILAVPLGVALAWLLVAVINVEAFGWRLPLHVFPLQWTYLFVLALVASLLAAAGPALRLARMQPARLASVFANER